MLGGSNMPRTRDPHFKTGHLCRFCGELVPWGTILRIIRVDPDTPGYMLNETACHTECLAGQLRPGVELTFPRHWGGGPIYLDDNDDIYLSTPAQPIPSSPAQPFPSSPAKAGVQSNKESRLLPSQEHHSSSPTQAGAQPEKRLLRPCAMCGEEIAPPELVRLRIQKPVGPVKRPEFDEQSLPVHFECLARVSTTRFG